MGTTTPKRLHPPVQKAEISHPLSLLCKRRRVNHDKSLIVSGYLRSAQRRTNTPIVIFI